MIVMFAIATLFVACVIFCCIMFCCKKQKGQNQFRKTAKNLTYDLATKSNSSDTGHHNHDPKIPNYDHDVNTVDFNNIDTRARVVTKDNKYKSKREDSIQIMDDNYTAVNSNEMLTQSTLSKTETRPTTQTSSNTTMNEMSIMTTYNNNNHDLSLYQQ